MILKFLEHFDLGVGVTFLMRVRFKSHFVRKKRLKGINLIFLGIFLLALLTSCDFFEEEEQRKAVVRVNDSYLYEEDIEGLLSDDTGPEDSAVIVSAYINRWATQQLIMDRAELNLPEETLAEYEDLVESYRNELYTKAYTEALVNKNLDSSFAEEKIEDYYEANKENFKLRDDLVKLRYVHVDKSHNKLDEIKDWLRDFEEEDRLELDKVSLQFKDYSFNDSVWVKTGTVYRKIDLLSEGDRNNFLRKDHFLELEDSLSVYLVYVNDVLEKNEQAPLEYASNTVKQILLNKRKLELTKELEKEITKDAIENKQFEIYD